MRRSGKGPRCPTKQDSLQSFLMCYTTGHLEHFTQRNPERHFVKTRLFNIARDAEHLGTRRFLSTDLTIFFSTFGNDQWHIAKSFNIVDDGWLTEQSVRSWEWRLDARKATFAFNGFK